MVPWKHPMPPLPKEFYEELRHVRPGFRKVDEFIIDLEERGKAWIVKKGQSTRIVCIEQAQLTDVCVWNANNPEEHFWDDYTLTRETPFLSTYSRLWSNLPMFRPLMTIIEDTVETVLTHPGDHHHYCFGSHCNLAYIHTSDDTIDLIDVAQLEQIGAFVDAFLLRTAAEAHAWPFERQIPERLAQKVEKMMGENG